MVVRRRKERAVQTPAAACCWAASDAGSRAVARLLPLAQRPANQQADRWWRVTWPNDRLRQRRTRDDCLVRLSRPFFFFVFSFNCTNTQPSLCCQLSSIRTFFVSKTRTLVRLGFSSESFLSTFVSCAIFKFQASRHISNWRRVFIFSKTKIFSKTLGFDIFRHGSSSFLGQDGGRPSRRRTVKMPRGKAKRRPTNSPSESSAVPFFPTIAETNKKVGSTAHQTNNWPALTVFSPNRQTPDGTASRQQLGRLISEKCQPTRRPSRRHGREKERKPAKQSGHCSIPCDVANRTPNSFLKKSARTCTSW